MAFGRKEAIADIIKYEGDNSTFVWKHPREDFNSTTQLIVHESQEALFMMNGQALDLFGPGRHTLETQNIPFLQRLLNRPTGGKTPFHCEVYFINKTTQMSLKWGTGDKVRFVEPTMGIPVDLGAFGEMNLQVQDARKLLLKLVGTMNGIAWEDRESGGFTKSLQSSFRPMIASAVKAHLSAAIKSLNIDIVDIDQHLETLAEALRKRIAAGFEEYGLTVPQLYINNILLPENDENFQKLRAMHSYAFQAKHAEAKSAMDVASEVAARAAKLESATTDIELQKKQAELELIKAQTAAQAKRLDGFADAEIMQAKGYNQKDVFQRDVQIAFAEGLGQMGANGGGGGGGMVGDMVGLGIGMAAAGTMSAQMMDMFKGMPGANNAAPAAPAAPVAPAAPAAPEAPAETPCPTCGKPVPANAKFCLECGTKIVHLAENEMLCPACGQKTPKGKFCMECGAPLIRKCPKCGNEVPDGAKFCLECGEKL